MAIQTPQRVPGNLPSPLMALKGVNGQLEIFPQKLVIKRKGGMAKMTQGFFAGEKDIYYTQIGSVKVKWGGGLTNGFIQFAPSGGIEGKRSLTKQTHDENTVIFKRANNDLVREIKDYVESQVSANGLGGAAAPAASRADELKKLADLVSQGVLTAEEFEAEKSRVLLS